LSYGRGLLIAVDQFFNAVFGGHPDETISSRWGRTKDTNKVAKIGCKVLDKIDHQHCDGSIEFTPDGQPDPHHLSGETRK
jgi:hypothetical protein